MYRLSATMSGYLKIETFAASREDCLDCFTAVAQDEARRRDADWSDQIAAICDDPHGHIDDLSDGGTFVDYERID